MEVVRIGRSCSRRLLRRHHYSTEGSCGHGIGKMMVRMIVHSPGAKLATAAGGHAVGPGTGNASRSAASGPSRSKRSVPRIDLEHAASARRSAECNVATGKDKAMRTALASTRARLALLLGTCPPVHAAPPARGSGSGGMEKTIRALERA
jgi:hypothetical protein